jgi:hypothetical protein
LTNDMREEVSKLKNAVTVFYKDMLEGAVPYFFERAMRTRGGDSQMHMHIHCIPIKAGVVSLATMKTLAVANAFDMNLQAVTGGQDCTSALCEFLNARARDCSSYSFESFEYFWAELPDGSNFLQVVSDSSQAKDNTQAKDILTNCNGTRGKNAEDSVNNADSQSMTLDDISDDTEKKSSITKKDRPRHPLHFGRKIAAELLDLPMRVDWKVCVGAIREEERTATFLRELFSPFVPDH